MVAASCLALGEWLIGGSCYQYHPEELTAFCGIFPTRVLRCVGLSVEWLLGALCSMLGMRWWQRRVGQRGKVLQQQRRVGGKGFPRQRLNKSWRQTR